MTYRMGHFYLTPAQHLYPSLFFSCSASTVDYVTVKRDAKHKQAKHERDNFHHMGNNEIQATT